MDPLCEKTRLSLYDAVDLFKTTYQGSPNTIQSYGVILRRFFAWCKTDNIHRISRLMVILYLKQNYAGKSPAAYNKNLFAIRAFFHFLAEYYDISDPTLKLHTRGQDQLVNPRVITLDEYKKIQSRAGQGRDIAVFLANTGIRIQEFLTIQAGQVDYTRRTLTVLGKGAKPRIIPLTKTALEILSRYQNRLNFRKNKPLKYHNIRYLFQTLAGETGIDAFGPHSFRHFFATYLIDQGVPIQVVSGLLGHADISLTISCYYHISLNDKLDCLEKLI